MNQVITRALLHQKSLKLLFSLILFLGLTGCSDDNDTTPTTTTISPPFSTTTTVSTSTTTTTINPLELTGIANDTAPKSSKTWTWDCEHDSGDTDDEDCEFRFVINQSEDSYTFSDSDDYTDVTTAIKSRGEDGTYYLHVQAKNANNKESDVETVSFILESATPKTLRVTGIEDDTSPKRSKTYTWSCNDTPCEFRFAVNQDPDYDLAANQSYGSSTTTTETSATTGQGTFYLHVQAKNTDDNEESDIKTVSFILEDLRVTGLKDDSRERSSKRWTWNCNTSPCTFRHAITQVDSHTFSSSDSYSSTRTVTETIDDVSNGEGKYYLHVQAKDADDNPSDVKTVFFALKNLEVTGLENDTTPRSSKTWTWACDNGPCTFRYEVNQSSVTHTFPPTQNYTSTISITRNVGTSSSGTSLTPGTYYLHVQAKDQYGVESEVEAASFTLQATSTNTLEVIGLVSDTTPTNSKTWNWNCDNPPCTFRYIINQSPTHTLSGTYNNDTATMKELAPGEEEGIYYLHVQAQDSNNNESEIKRVSFILQRERDFVSTLTLALKKPDQETRHPAANNELLLYPEKNPRIKVALDESFLQADEKIQFYSSLTCNPLRVLSDPITTKIDDIETADIDENAVELYLHLGVHNIYVGLVNGNELQCSKEDLEYVLYNPIVAGHQFTCHLASTANHVNNDNGEVNCWGSGANGRLGQGNTQNVSSPTSVLLTKDTSNPLLCSRACPLISIAKFITAGGHHSCAILEDNSVKCWGESSYGRLGNGNNDNDIGDSASNEIANASPVDLGTGRVAKMISAGGSHTCAILDNDDLVCWGRNNNGQLGLGHDDDIGDDNNEMGNNLVSVNLGTGRIAKTIATGEDHTCAILDNGDVKCWGLNDQGQLGLGNIDDYGDDSNEMVSALAKVILGAKAKAIVTGSHHTCAILGDDSVKCWGENDQGQLGLGDTDNYGNNETTFPSLDFGEWDDNDDGHLTDATPEVSLIAKAIAAGEDHTCALLSNNQVRCWGLNDYGQLGQENNNNYGSENIPVDSGTDGIDESDIAAIADITLGANYIAIAIAAGDKHTCVVLDVVGTNSLEGDVKCWGRNNNGQLSRAVDVNNEAMGDDLDEMGDFLSIISNVGL